MPLVIENIRRTVSGAAFIPGAASPAAPEKVTPELLAGEAVEVRLQGSRVAGIQTQRLFLVDQTCTFSPSYRDHANLRTAPARIAVLRTKIIAVTIAGREFAKATLGRPRKAFIELRYYYELPLKKGYGWTGMEISDCVRHVILELKPDWKDAYKVYTTRHPLSAEYPPGTLPTATPRVK